MTITDRKASRPKEFWQRYGIKKNRFYEEVKSGRLKIRKVGSATIILPEDEETWRNSLPTVSR